MSWYFKIPEYVEISEYAELQDMSKFRRAQIPG
jgi:hypothetical protein